MFGAMLGTAAAAQIAAMQKMTISPSTASPPVMFERTHA